MSLQTTLLRLDSAGRAQVLSRAPQYITNVEVLNLLNRIDVNRKETIAPTCALLRAFDAVPGVRDQIAAWLRG